MLSVQAQFHIKFEAAKTINEKFITCIGYATLIEQRKTLGKMDAVTIAAQQFIMGLIKSYLNSGIHPDTAGKSAPALFDAVTYPELVKLLLSRGANPDICYSGRNPLHEVARYFHTYYTHNLFLTAEILACFGANPGAINNDGKKPIELIKNTFWASQETISKLLMEFKQVTECPRHSDQIINANEETVPPSSLPLTEADLLKIGLYQKGRYKQLIQSDPIHRAVHALFLPFRSHQTSRMLKSEESTPFYWPTKEILGNHDNDKRYRPNTRLSTIDFDMTSILDINLLPRWSTPAISSSLQTRVSPLPGVANAEQPIIFRFYPFSSLPATPVVTSEVAKADLGLDRLTLATQPGTVSALLTQSVIFKAPPKRSNEAPMETEEDFVIVPDDAHDVNIEIKDNNQKKLCRIM